MLKFTESKLEDELIGQIVERAMLLNINIADKCTLYMDLSAANAACPLKLDKLLIADNYNFVHDVSGIQRHINRKTGELENCFLPRFAY